MPSYASQALESTNANALRSYPFAYTATRRDLTGILTLPNSLITHLRLPVPADLGVDPDAIYIGEVILHGGGVIINVSYNGDVVATAAVDSASHTPYRTYRLSGRGLFQDCVGTVGIGYFRDIDALPIEAGPYAFDLAGGRLDPICIDIVPRGLRALIIQRADGSTARLQGPVEVVAGPDLSVSLLRSGDTDTIRLDAVPQAGLVALPGDADPDADTVRTINGVSGPNITLTSDGCVAITASTGSIGFENTCSTSCCDCAEASEIRSIATDLANSVRELSRETFRQEDEIVKLQDAMLGSNLTNKPCATCGGG